MLSFTITSSSCEVGDIITVDHKNYKVTKRTATAVDVTRYYWFDKVYDWIVAKVTS